MRHLQAVWNGLLGPEAYALVVVLVVAWAALAAPPKAPPVAPPKAPPVESGVVTYSPRLHPDTAGRMALWNWPSDPAIPPVFLGYCTAFR